MSCTDSWDTDKAGHEGVQTVLICFKCPGKLHILLLTESLPFPALFLGCQPFS